MSRFYYLSSRFIGERSRLISKKAPLDRVTVEADDPRHRAKLLEFFEYMQYERCGVLLGEYICTEHGHLLIDETAQFTKINLDGEGDNDIFPSTFVHNQITDELDATYLDIMMNNWKCYPVFENIPIITTFWNINYYHFTFELLTKLNMFNSFKAQAFAMPNFCVAKTIQRDLLHRALGQRNLIPYKQPIRVRDPLLAQTYLSQDGILWLRSMVGQAPKPGLKRYYLRRVRSNRRVGFGGVSEDAAFLAMLARFGFEVIDFGDGELNVAEQLHMLEGAQIILSPHGASLTNIAYLNKPVTIIELFSSQHIAGMYAYLSAILGFDYVALISDRLDQNGNIIIDSERLTAILTNI